MSSSVHSTWILVAVSLFFWTLSIIINLLSYSAVKATEAKMADANTKISEATINIAETLENNKDLIINTEIAILRLNDLENAICKDQPQLLPSFCS